MKQLEAKSISIYGNTELKNAVSDFVLRLSKIPTLSNYINGLMADKGLTAPNVYHRANLDRRTFNKLIQFSKPKRAGKRTLLQVAIGINASEHEAIELLATCGYAFELSAIEDQAYLFCIRNGIYDMLCVYAVIDIIVKFCGGAMKM